MFPVWSADVDSALAGAAYAQIIDSVYGRWSAGAGSALARSTDSLWPLSSGNVPMPKLNFAAKHDYEYINNYKVLQETFKRNKIDKVGGAGRRREPAGFGSGADTER